MFRFTPGYGVGACVRGLDHVLVDLYLLTAWRGKGLRTRFLGVEVKVVSFQIWNIFKIQ